MQLASADSWRMRGILSHGVEKTMLLFAAVKSGSMREACKFLWKWNVSRGNPD